MFLTVLDILGVYAFAISGCVLAASKKMDYFGMLIIGMITAVGGGTTRDLILGSTPVAWVTGPEYILTILLAGVSTAIAYRWILKLSKMMFIFDTLGIATCTVLGAQKALDMNVLWYVASLFGVMTAVFGGVIRDIICNRIPLIFRKEIYATACLSGAVLYCALYYYLGTEWRWFNTVLSMLLIVLIRVLAVRFKWRIPVLKMPSV